jgi:hypothetical protein
MQCASFDALPSSRPFLLVSYSSYAVGTDAKLGRQLDNNAGKLKKVVLGNDRGVVAGMHLALAGMRKGGVRFAILVSLDSDGRGAALTQPALGQPPPHSPDGVRAFRIELSKLKRGGPAEVVGASSPGAAAPAGERGAILDRMKNIAVQAWPAGGGADAPTSGAGSRTSGRRESLAAADDDEGDLFGARPATAAVAVYDPKAAEVLKQMEAMRAEVERLKTEAEVERRVQARAREAEEAKARQATAAPAPQQQPQQQPLVVQYQPPQPQYQPYGAPPTQYLQAAPPMQPQMQMVQPSASTSSVQELMETKEWRRHVEGILVNVAGKVDTVHARIEHSFLGKQASQEEAMTGGNLLKALRRLIDENEQRGTELSDKNERLDSLRATIALLHEKNEKLLDERNKLVEARNDTVRETTDQSRKAVEGLRGEKEKLESELLVTQDKLSKSKRKYGSLERVHDQVRLFFDSVCAVN